MPRPLKRFLNQVFCGDACQVLRKLPANSIDAVVTDPPYGIGFMDKAWDSFRPNNIHLDRAEMLDKQVKDQQKSLKTCTAAKSFEQRCQSWAREVYRVLKPGGHLLAFGGTRTYHRLTCGIEDAGFEIRDSIHWVYGNGFPKSLDISKALDKLAGEKRQVIARQAHGSSRREVKIGQTECAEYVYSLPATPAARKWQGWGTARKPAHEPTCVARKPLSESTVAENVLRHGVGAINIDACRIRHRGQATYPKPTGKNSGFASKVQAAQSGMSADSDRGGLPSGRWPSNFLLSHIESTENGERGCRHIGTKHIKNPAGSTRRGGPRQNRVYGKDHHPRGTWKAYGDRLGYELMPKYVCAEDCPVALLDWQTGYSKTRRTEDASNCEGQTWGSFQTNRGPRGYTDQGYGSRFFKVIEPTAPFIYRAKPAVSEKDRNCQGLYWRYDKDRVSGFAPISQNEWEKLGQDEDRRYIETGQRIKLRAQGNIHPTVKGVALLEYLIRLITPQGGIVLDPFAGSGTTGVAARSGGWRYILVEQNPDYVHIAKARLR